jgi:hypothetical protein
MSWVHRRTEPSLWTVGFYAPDGSWRTDSDHDSQESASERVHYLNGGHLVYALRDFLLEDDETNARAIAKGETEAETPV